MDHAFFILLGAIYGVTLAIMLYQLELWLNIRCRLGFHNKKRSRCTRCKKIKTHLKVIQGGKKSIETRFPF